MLNLTALNPPAVQAGRVERDGGWGFRLALRVTVKPMQLGTADGTGILAGLLIARPTILQTIFIDNDMTECQGADVPRFFSTMEETLVCAALYGSV